LKRGNQRTFLRDPLDFSFRERERNRTQVEEEYCWATTWVAGRSCYGGLGYNVNEFGF